jgi:hypothetical protein
MHDAIILLLCILPNSNKFYGVRNQIKFAIQVYAYVVYCLNMTYWLLQCAMQPTEWKNNIFLDGKFYFILYDSISENSSHENFLGTVQIIVYKLLFDIGLF